MRTSAITLYIGFIILLLATTAPVLAATSIGNLKFTNTPLLLPGGDSEPEISISSSGLMVMVALTWLNEPDFTNLWKGPFGATPVFQGSVDANITNHGDGGHDADVDLGSTGTLHVSTLISFFNPTSRLTQLGVSAITCPNADTSNNFANCKAQIIDTTQADRPWITSDGPHVYISYHDSGLSSLIHVQRSDDDGFTWHRVADPIPGHDGVTGNSTFNNAAGKIIADPFTHNVYVIWNAGFSSVQKAKTANFNNVYVARSTNMGQSWTTHLVFSGTVNVALDNVFPTLAVDPTNGMLYSAWSNAHQVSFATSSDQADTWTTPTVVNISPANTAVLPWLAAYAGGVDLVYYGTTSSSKDDTGAVWNVYMAQTTDNGAHFTQSLVTAHPNHVGVICTDGPPCSSGTRNLLDLFQVAIDPLNGKAAIIYTDDTLTTTSTGSPLPQVSLAQQQ